MRTRTVDRVAVDARAAKFTRRSLKRETKVAGLRLALAMTDLTTLEGKDSPERIRALCRKAVQPAEGEPGIPSVAAVCVYPRFVALARGSLEGSGVRVASVATAFPSGQTPLPLRVAEVRGAVEDGADEIDMVISRGCLLSGGEDQVFHEIGAVKEACGAAHLKVILETGELETYDLVRRASDLAIGAGADFVKTSTGKIQPAATMGVTLVLMESVRDHWLRTGRRIGVKPAGGISSAKQALHYLVMVKETLGEAWLDPALFRFGASSLANDLVRQLLKQRDGNYLAPYDLTES
ncbi:MAG: deoxyribose-phosphate aldolase [Planctomycetes bacterium]|nr:deoxyribose-phosphate aldolase [Planctomycetota bacterium]